METGGGGGLKMTSNRQTYPNEFAWFSNFQLEGRLAR